MGTGWLTLQDMYTHTHRPFSLLVFISLSRVSPSLACHSVSLAATLDEVRSVNAPSNSCRLECCKPSSANLSYKCACGCVA